MLSFALAGGTGFSIFPLQIRATASASLGVLAILVAIIISILRVGFGENYFGGQATTIILLLLHTSFQLFFLFIMGQYIARIYDETRGRPLYIVASTSGFDKQPVQNIETPPRDYVVPSTGGYGEAVDDK
jgi:dolichol-phosphate mannosyltransferase